MRMHSIKTKACRDTHGAGLLQGLHGVLQQGQ